MRILYDPKVRKVQQSVSRMDETHAEEYDIPHYSRWEDGSEYECYEEDPDHLVRRFHGPQFGLPLGQWKTERWFTFSS